VTDVSIPLGAQGFRNPRRALLTILFALAAVIAVLSWSAVKAEAEKQDCNSVLWNLVIQRVQPELYVKKCGGCPTTLGLRLCLSTGSLSVL